MSINNNFVLLTGHFNCKDIKRTREIKQCILANSLIFKHIVVLFENWELVKNDPEYKYIVNTPNISIVKVNERQNYKTYFDWAYKNAKNKNVVIANSDILFDYTLNRINEFDMTNTLVALTRWQQLDKDNWSIYTLPIQGNLELNWSYDTYIFNPSLCNIDTNDINISIGVAGCDTYLVKKLSCQGVTIKNPVYDIRTYHVDYRDLENVDKQSNINGDTYWNRQDYPFPGKFIPSNINGFDGSYGLKMTAIDPVNYYWNNMKPLLQRKITAITACLWGTNKKYYNHIERIVSQCLDYYPDMTFILVIQHDNVDMQKLESLKNWPNVKIISKKENYGKVLNMTWRFEILDNPHVDTILSRDLDSIILKREVLAVREWLKSGKRLHVMRDHPHHDSKVMGGMVGIKRLPYLKKTMKEVIMKYKDRCDEFEIDQIILRAEIYPLCSSFNDIIVHASYNAYESIAKPFPIQYDESKHFVGSYVDENGNPEKQYTDMISLDHVWIKGKTHSDIELVMIDSNTNINHSFDLFHKFIQTHEIKNRSYCIVYKLNDDMINKIINLAKQQDTKKVLVGQNNLWIVINPYETQILLQYGLKQFIEKTGNILMYQF